MVAEAALLADPRARRSVFVDVGTVARALSGALYSERDGPRKRNTVIARHQETAIRIGRT